MYSFIKIVVCVIILNSKAYSCDPQPISNSLGSVFHTVLATSVIVGGMALIKRMVHPKEEKTFEMIQEFGITRQKSFRIDHRGRKHVLVQDINCQAKRVEIYSVHNRLLGFFVFDDLGQLKYSHKHVNETSGELSSADQEWLEYYYRKQEQQRLRSQL
jgi:hypothetical protein